MLEILVPLLVFLTVTAIGGAILVNRIAKRRPLQERLRETHRSIDAVSEDRPDPALHRTLGRLGALAGEPSPKLKEELARCGYHSPDTQYLYLGAKMLCFTVGIIGGAALALPGDMTMVMKSMSIVSAGAFLSFLPNLIVASRRRKRRKTIQRHLPDSLDLLEICVSSGMAMDAAWNSVAEEIRGVCGPLADEMALTNLELHLGGSRAVAMRNMAKRTGVDDITSFVAVLVQSERFGTSIGEAVRTFAGSMREERSLRAQEAAEKMAVKLLIPLVLFIFPALFAVLVGPAGIQIIDTFSQR